MSKTPALRNSIRYSAFLLSVLMMLSCDRETQHEILKAGDKEIVVVHAGAANGAYARLVELLNNRSEVTSESCREGKSTPGGSAYSFDRPLSGLADWAKSEQPTYCMSEFKFEVACVNGGTVPNLVRLGMPSFSGSSLDRFCEAPEQRTNKPTKGNFNPANEFALAQNFFIHGAARTRNTATRIAAENCESEDSPDCKPKKAEDYLRKYEYFDDLRIVLPMYYGRIQLISTSDFIPGTLNSKSIEKLKGEHIFLGNQVNTPHGREILGRHPVLVEGLDELTYSTDQAIEKLKEEVGTDYIPPRGQKSLGNVLLACGIVEAYVISGEIIEEKPPSLPIDLPEICDDNISLRQIPVPEVIIDGMVADNSYYQKLDAPDSLRSPTRLAGQPAYVQPGFEHKMPAVTTYLVTTSSTNNDLVMRVTGALHDDWFNLMLLNDDLVALEENIYKLPAPMHAGAKMALQNVGLMGKDRVNGYLALALSLLLGTLFWKTEVSYDRLGTENSSPKGRALFRFLLIVLGTVMFFILIVKFIRMLEEIQATGLGTDNPIANKGFEEVLLWMFTFVSSGYENNVFPSSPYSIFVVALFATIGVALPIWLIVKVIDHMREARLSRARGNEYRGWWEQRFNRVKAFFKFGYRGNGILLLCGWNNKAPGLIYSLTCPDSPYEGVVNIVADMDVEYPINHYHFNRKRVRFYRGDSSQRASLEKADGLHASSALILADYNTGSSSNSAGVLTALALRKLEAKRNAEKLFVAAEMTLKENDRQFSAGHINDIVDPRLIARRMLSIACFNEYLLDFVLDALSPDDHCEWYAVDEKTLSERFLGAKRGVTIEDFCRAMQQHEMTVIGICPEQDLDFSELFSTDFNEDACLDPLISIESIQRPMPPGSYVIFAAENPRSFKKRGTISRFFNSGPGPEIKFSADKILHELPEEPSILIIGHKQQTKSLAKHIKKSFNVSRTGTIATDDGKNSDKAIRKSIEKENWSHVILLSSLPETHSATEYRRYSKQADTETILRASLIGSTLGSGESKPKVIAEINDAHSSQLAKDAMVTSVVPSALLVERILARLVSGRGHVSEMLSTMMLTSTGVYLQSVRVSPGDPLIGKTLSEVLSTWFADGRVLGIWPESRSDQFKNDSGDFDKHFAMCPTKADRDIKLRAGDVAIVLAYPKRKQQN